MATKVKKTAKPESALTAAAQAVGTALGKLALKVGVATAPAVPVKRKKKKSAPRKAAAKVKAPAKKQP